jgi:hypothetical protein
MRVLQALCGLSCLLCVLSSATGIASIEVADRVVITRHGEYGRLCAAIAALVLAAAVYGIQKRAVVVWALGWVALVTSFLSFVVTGLSMALQQPPPGREIMSIFIVIGGSVVTVFWGLWWKHQREYFGLHNDQEAEDKGKSY